MENRERQQEQEEEEGIRAEEGRRGQYGRRKHHRHGRTETGSGPHLASPWPGARSGLAWPTDLLATGTRARRERTGTQRTA